MVHGKKKGMKKKYKAGEATQYISRKHARKKLQVRYCRLRRKTDVVCYFYYFENKQIKRPDQR